jgi:PAS domain S-box-containing protein
MVQTGVGRRFEFRVISESGEARLLQSEGTPIRDSSGQVSAVLGVGRDVTDEYRTNEALREREELLRTIFEHAPGGIAIADLAHNLVRANPAFARLVGYSEAELQGKPIDDFTHEEDVPANDAVFDELLTGKRKRCVIDKRYRRKDGTIIWVHVTVALVRGPADEPRYTVALSEDITEQKQAEDAMRRSAAELQALSRRLVDLQESERRELARELHDRVGQSLTALSLNLGILRGALSSHRNADVRSRLQDSAALVEATARAIENVASDLRPPMLDDHGLVAALQWYAREFSERAETAVSVRGDERERLTGDVEIALFRIAQEALNNVAKHARATSVAVKLGRSGSGYEMSITDNGVGLGGIREQADRSRLGLGMVTMRERAQAAGGAFDVQALPGGGTRLTVQVPC